jgi:hypothetical protein
LRPDYVQEGQFFAWPLAVSGECEPIPPDSAQVCAVAPTPDGRVVWGATDGEECHVFAALFKGAAGGIVDLGVIPEAFTIRAVVPIPGGHPLAVGPYSALALAWIGPGWELWRCQSPSPHDSVQEPGYGHAPPEQLASGYDHEACGLALLGDRPVVWTDRSVWALESDGSTSELMTLPAMPVCAPVHLDDAYWWLNDEGELVGLALDGSLRFVEIAIPLRSDVAILCAWGDSLLAADGVLYDLDPSTNTATPLAQAPLPDVQCLAGLPDGRAYGVCGHGIGHVFRVDREPAQCVALGAAATAVGHHRYGFEFAGAATSAEGAIFLGEHDRGGHLWAYYPSLG